MSRESCLGHFSSPLRLETNMFFFHFLIPMKQTDEFEKERIFPRIQSHPSKPFEFDLLQVPFP